MTLTQEIELNRRLQRMEQMLTALVGSLDRQVGIAEAARILGCTKQALYKRIERGQVPCEVVNGRYKFSRTALLSL